MEIRDIIIVIIGIISGILLCCRFPIVKKGNKPTDKKVSIVIPCRNEEKNIANLLKNLMSQKIKPFEIICVNDHSTDNTSSVISSFEGVRLLDLMCKPEDWKGKPFALTEGAKIAKGEVILFLDADVTLGEDGLLDLFSLYEHWGTFSVHPYHKTVRFGESFSLFFNMISIAGTGITLPKPIQKGMFGPVFMVDKETYFDAGAHEVVKSSIVEDFALGKHYAKEKVPYTLFIGNKSIGFRMYPEGMKSQAQGFIKNFSSGATSAGFVSNLLTVLYITAISLTFIQMIVGMVRLDLIPILFYGGCYLFFAIHLYFVSSKLGHFNRLMSIFYFLPLIWFIVIFLVSIIAKVFGIKVTWKGRKLKS